MDDVCVDSVKPLQVIPRRHGGHTLLENMAVSGESWPFIEKSLEKFQTYNGSRRIAVASRDEDEQKDDSKEAREHDRSL